MKRVFCALSAAVLAANGAVTNAWAADCASLADLAALKTAAMQQELMVAAFSCHDVALYNRFVLAHQPELIDSDARLKAFFVRRDSHRSEAGYHAFKTELANESSLRSSRDADSFCADADAEFRLALQPANLSEAVDAEDWNAGGAYPACRADSVLAMTQTDGTRPDALADDRAGPRADRHPDAADRRARHGASAAQPDDADRNAAAMSAELVAPAPHRRIQDGDTL